MLAEPRNRWDRTAAAIRLGGEGANLILAG